MSALQTWTCASTIRAGGAALMACGLRRMFLAVSGAGSIQRGEGIGREGEASAGQVLVYVRGTFGTAEHAGHCGMGQHPGHAHGGSG